MEKSKVYFTPVSEADTTAAVAGKLKKLIAESRILDFLSADMKVAVKMHFGEEGNTGFVRPDYVKVVCDTVSQKRANPLLSETNTLYKGRRTNSKDHLALAAEHGFTKKAIGAEIVIPANSSNWACYGIEACLAKLLDKPEVMHDESVENRILINCANVGIPDGATAMCTPTIDGASHEACIYAVGQLKQTVLMSRVELIRESR